jgi:hypothetical protein
MPTRENEYAPKQAIEATGFIERRIMEGEKRKEKSGGHGNIPEETVKMKKYNP